MAKPLLVLFFIFQGGILQKALDPCEKQFQQCNHSCGEGILSSICKEGKELTLVLYKEGDFFPVVWTFFGGDRGSIYFFEAITNTEILRSPREAFMDFIKSHQEIFLDVTKHIIMRFRSALRRMEFLTFGDASAKLASVLLICGKDFGIEKNNETEIKEHTEVKEDHDDAKLAEKGREPGARHEVIERKWAQGNAGQDVAKGAVLLELAKDDAEN